MKNLNSSKNPENEIQLLAQNKELTIEQQPEGVEKILTDTPSQANKRLATAHQTRDKHKDAEEEFEESRLIWNNIFLWFQISGTALLTVPEIIDKWIIKNP